jgi:hypothetical protein
MLIKQREEETVALYAEGSITVGSDVFGLGAKAAATAQAKADQYDKTAKLIEVYVKEGKMPPPELFQLLQSLAIK